MLSDEKAISPTEREIATQEQAAEDIPPQIIGPEQKDVAMLLCTEE